MKSKNIHVLPTDKPSRVRIGNNGNFVIGLTQSATASKNDSYTNQHIYITSDEEIKEGDYFIAYSVTIDKKPYISCASEYKERKKEKGKIILTTDQDLINDGVQAITDEFLEWFVKNPNCEEVDIELEIGSLRWSNSKNTHKIIYPKEEPKQDLPNKLESVLAKITHQNDLGLSQWYEVVYYSDGKWCSYSGSKTFEDGERVVEWKYCKDLI